MSDKVTITVTESTWQEIYLAFGRLELWDGEPAIDFDRGTIDMGNVTLQRAKFITRIESIKIRAPGGSEREAFAVYKRGSHGIDMRAMVCFTRAEAQQYIDGHS